MRIWKVFCIVILLSLGLHAVPKFFFVRTYGTPDGARYDAQRNLIYVSSPQTSQVVAVAADTGLVQKSVYVPNAAGLDITPDGKELVVGTTAFGGWYGDTFLTFVDLDTFTVAERTPITNPMRQNSAGQLSIYSPFIRRVVALSNGNILFTVSPQDSTETWVGEYRRATHTFSLIATGSGVLVPSDNRKYVLLPGMGSFAGLELFDAEADAIISSNPELDSIGVALSHDGRLVVYCVDQHSALILDGSTLQPIRTIATPTAGCQVAFSPDNSKVYVEKFATPAFYVFDVNTGLIQGAFTVPGDDHDSVNLLGVDSRGMLYSSLDRGLAVTDPGLAGFFEPLSQFAGTSYPYVASPSAGLISGGAAITIRQSYPAHPTVYFADKPATITGSDSNSISAISPAGDRAGPVDITVVYDDGFVAYIPEGFSYGPAIEYLDRDGGTSSGGDSLTLFALGLRSASTTGVQVRIGGAAATVNSVSPILISPMKSPTYRINLTTPAGNPGAADVVLTTGDGSATSKGGFNYVPVTHPGGDSTISHLLYDDSRGYLYRCNYGKNRIEVVSTATSQFIKQYSTDASPVAMALTPDRGTLYVTTSGSVIDVIELDTGAQRSIQLTMPSGMTMTRIGVTSQGTLFVGIYNPDVYYDSRLIEIDPSNGSYTTRLQGFNGNFIELGLSRDGTHAFISSDLESGASGNRLYYWDSFTDSFRQQFVSGWSDYGVDDAASLLLGGGQTYDPASDIHNVFETFSFDVANNNFVWGEKLDDSGALALRPSLDSLVIYDVHHGNRVARIALPANILATLDAMSVDSGHGVAYISSTAGLLVVPLPKIMSIGRIEPAQGLTSGGQIIVVRGIGLQPNATVTIGGQSASTVFVNSTTLRVTTPALPLGPASIRVTNDDGSIYDLAAAYSAVDTQPIVSSTSPSELRISAGLSSLPVGVIGMSFVPGAAVLWNGSPRSTYFVDENELHVDLEAGDATSAGAATLAVRNPDGGLSNEITVVVKDYPNISLPGGFSFDAQVVNTTSALQTGTVTNSSADPVTLSFSVESPFTLTTDCPATIAAGASCTLSVGFNPTIPGMVSSAIVVRGDIIANIELKGVAGLAAATISVTPSQVKFPLTNSFSPKDASVIVTNIGIPDVTVTNVSTDSGDFSADSYTNNLITGQTGLVVVTFRPTVAGPRTGNLVISSTAGIVTVPLTGIGAPQLGFDMKALSVQAVKGQITASKAVVTFSNPTGGNVSIGSVYINAVGQGSAFSETNTCPAVLNTGASCQITVGYVPSGKGTDTADLVVSLNATSYDLPLVGALTDFTLSGSSSSATVSAGQTATYPISIDRTGGYNGDLSFSCSGQPAYSTCMVTPEMVSAGSGVTTVNVSVTTTARVSARLRWRVIQSLAFAMMAIGCLLLRTPTRSKLRLVLLVFSMLTLNGCGGGGSSSGGGSTPPPNIRGTPSGTYTLTVTATTPVGATRNMSLTLGVN